MLSKIVWQGFVENKPSKIARQSTVCIWFDPQNSFSTWDTDCGSNYSSAYPVCGRRRFSSSGFPQFGDIYLQRKVLTVFPLGFQWERWDNISTHYRDSAAAKVVLARVRFFCWYDCFQCLNSGTGGEEGKFHCKACLPFTGILCATHQLRNWPGQH